MRGETGREVERERCSLEETERNQTEQVLTKWIMALWELLVKLIPIERDCGDYIYI